MPSQLVRLFHTARYLRAEQIHGQIRRRVAASSRGWARSASGGAPAFPGCRWSEGKVILPPANVGFDQEGLRQGRFRFLNITADIGFPPRWDCDGQPRLWLYNLHYFDWLWLLDFDAARLVVLDWVARCENGSGRVGWEPYPTSVRLMNWCGFFFGRFRRETEENADFREELWRSLFRQCERLGGRVETHLLNNHYLENGAALAFVGSCFQGRDARRWLDNGCCILRDQVSEQILSDGMHFELSPMYHCRVLYVLTLLLETETATITGLLTDSVQRMSQALGRIRHPDGEIALLGDSAKDVYHRPHRLQAAVHEPGCFALPDAGYYGWRGADGTYLIADYGGIGPDHNPGHGHADMFSFELSLGGCRVVTDTGVHDYELSALRQRCRSTAAHNTVELNGQDQCELWGAFRVARRGYPRDVTWLPDDNGFVLSGWHDGYRRLPGKPIHWRQMQWDCVDGLIVHDRITARRPVRCVSRLHLHPTCRVVRCGARCVLVSYPAGVFRVEATADIEVEETPYFERFYETLARPCLCLVGRGDSVELQYHIQVGEVFEKKHTVVSER